jgi:osmoprotectant transport system substrate-binding protein
VSRSKRSPSLAVVLAVVLAAVLAGVLVGCGGLDKVYVGSKSFSESKLLAEMLALRAEARGIPVERAIPYREGRVCLRGVQEGVLDVYPEYTGTLLSLGGLPATTDADAAYREAHRIVRDLGLELGPRLGVRNDYAIAVRRDVALRRRLATISDLAKLDGPVRFASDTEATRRSGDGIPALARRYGLTLGGVQRFPPAQRSAWFDALVEGRVDAAEVYATDPRVTEYGLVLLKDDLDFYPSYEAAPLARQDALERHPKLRAVLDDLAGKIDTEAMRDMVARVEGRGDDYREVARAHLEQVGLLPKTETATLTRHEVPLAIGPADDVGYLPIQAARALRQVMPVRRLVVSSVTSPAEAVRSGRARFGLVGSGEFLIPTPTGFQMGDGMEAVGVVGSRLVHVLAPEGVRLRLTGRGRPLRLGVEAEGSASHRVAALLMDALELGERLVLVPGDGVREKLERGEVDALLFMVELGHPRVLEILQDGLADLRSFPPVTDPRLTLRYPILRPARIPAATYPGQQRALETVSSQVVLASFVPPEASTLGDSGPGIAGLTRDVPLRLPPHTAAEIAVALQATETVDPILPASPGLRPTAPPARARVVSDIATAVVNVLGIAYLAAMAFFMFMRMPETPDLEDGPPE